MYGKSCFFFKVSKKFAADILRFYVRIHVIDSSSVLFHPSSLKPELLLIGRQDFQWGQWETPILLMEIDFDGP